MIEADKRMRAHEVVVRQQKRIARDAEVWRRYEAEFEGRGASDVVSANSGAELRKGGSGSSEGSGR